MVDFCFFRQFDFAQRLLCSKYAVGAFSTMFCLFFLFSCEQPVDWDVVPGENDRPVVEAILTDELKTQKIYLTRSFSGLNDDAPFISDASITVSANGQSVRFLHESAGLYKSEEPFKIKRNLTYVLNIDIDGEEYTAESKLSEVAPIPEIKFKQYEQTDSLQFVDFASLFNPNQQAIYEMNVDWSHLTVEGSTSARLYFYTFSTVDVSQINPTKREPVSFPKGSVVEAVKFGLNDDFAAYLRALLIETDWNGSFFYSSGFDLPTNISNGGLGFFSTCAVVKKTVVARE